ncbi:5'-nucleotidase, lipoprotein e(P4) family [Mucilaginibacter agri]|uniref:5'-nucleotidase n=1 Tax=Mucilaginibacter agri TaxID=2695265 RepID=A0A965ZJS7_9SPHI|nr:HAD family acid phosphatase [Mucilaginibacter agri]NCD72468.1 5'-nucleotidase [Mucilaginibacter agri]
MKKILLLIILVLGTGLIFAFSVLKYTEKKLADENSLLGIMYQQNAAEYEALCLQAYHMAKVQAETAWATNKDHDHLAIVTDLDETALDNTPGEAFDYQQDKQFEISQWWLHGRPRAVPGAVEFFNWAHQKGFHIYYVSNRPNVPAIIDSTREQMKLLGFPLTATAKDDRYFMFAPKGVSTKQPRRDSITHVLKDNIILLLGDNLPDVSAEFDKVDGKYLADTTRCAIAKNMKDSWGTKFIVLPNAYYGDWESTYYQAYRDANPDSIVTIQKKYAIRESILKTYDFIKSK